MFHGKFELHLLLALCLMLVFIQGFLSCKLTVWLQAPMLGTVDSK